MKATGIVRRIDDLGRVVIPKEVRRTLRIREGDPLEIYVERGAKSSSRSMPPTILMMLLCTLSTPQEHSALTSVCMMTSVCILAVAEWVALMVALTLKQREKISSLSQMKRSLKEPSFSSR